MMNAKRFVGLVKRKYCDEMSQWFEEKYSHMDLNIEIAKNLSDRIITIIAQGIVNGDNRGMHGKISMVYKLLDLDYDMSSVKFVNKTFYKIASIKYAQTL